MAIPIPLLLAGAGIVDALFRSQQYYPAAQAPSRADIYGQALGAGLGGLLGGSVLGPLAGLPAGGSVDPATVDPATAAPVPGSGIPDPAAGGGLTGDERAILDFLTNGGITGAGFGGSTGGAGLATILEVLGKAGTVPAASRAPATIMPTGIPGAAGLGAT